MVKQPPYTFPEKDSNGSKLESWEDIDDLCEHDEMDDHDDE